MPTAPGDAGGLSRRTRCHADMALERAAERGLRSIAHPFRDIGQHRACRLHLAGRLGTQRCRHCPDQGWLLKRSGTRALAVAPKGAVSFQVLLGRSAWDGIVRGAKR